MSEIHHYVAGRCRSYERLARRDRRWRVVHFPAGWNLIQQPSGPPILFDTGYAPRVIEAMRRLPFRIYRSLLPIDVREEETAAAQVSRLGWKMADIRWIIISHFHVDHIGGLHDFPNATFVCSHRAWSAVASLQGWAAMRRGFVPRLIPDDFEQRVQFSEHLPKMELPGCDLDARRAELDGLQFDLVSLEGHARGQIGLWYQNGAAADFLVADACWTPDLIVSDDAMPHPWAMRIQDDRAAYLQTIRQLRTFHQAHKDVRFLTSHQWEPGNV